MLLEEGKSPYYERRCHGGPDQSYRSKFLTLESAFRKKKQIVIVSRNSAEQYRIKGVVRAIQVQQLVGMAEPELRVVVFDGTSHHNISIVEHHSVVEND